MCIGPLRGTKPYQILSDEERGHIVEMHEGAMKSSNIASILNVPQSVVSTFLTNWNAQGSVKSLKSRCGRHQKLSDPDARVLACYVRDDRRQPLLELSSLLNVSHNTTRSYLHDLGYRNCVAPNKPCLSEKHKLDRLKFPRAHESWSFEDWCNVICIAPTKEQQAIFYTNMSQH